MNHIDTMIEELTALVVTAEQKAIAKQIFADELLCAEIAELIQEYTKTICRGCGNLSRNCDCPPVDPRTELYDDPARSAR